jgi:putative oxidoreductase
LLVYRGLGIISSFNILRIMKILTSIPVRVVYAVTFALLAINHFINADSYLRYVPTFLPDRILWIYLIGIFLLVTSYAVTKKKYTKQACLVLSIYLILVVFSVHIPGLFFPKIMQASMLSILKDTGLAGSGLFLASVIGISESE